MILRFTIKKPHNAKISCLSVWMTFIIKSTYLEMHVFFALKHFPKVKLSKEMLLSFIVIYHVLDLSISFCFFWELSFLVQICIQISQEMPLLHFHVVLFLSASQNQSSLFHWYTIVTRNRPWQIGQQVQSSLSSFTSPHAAQT